MMKKLLLYTFLIYPFLFNNTAYPQRLRCGTQMGDINDTRRKVRETQAQRSSGSVPVIFHIIYNSNNEGDLSFNTIKDQFDVLQNKFSGTGIQYTFSGYTKTQKNAWFDIDAFGSTGSEIYQMRSALHIDTQHVLNVYITKLSGAIGIAKYPWDSAFDQHGVVIDYTTVPGGSHSYANEGKTLVHEAGHYWGLLHLWDYTNDHCQEVEGTPAIDEIVYGDDCADTPIQLNSTYGCPSFKDSCPGDGEDSYHNYMDYSYDVCMYEFTNDQIDRMNLKRSEYRPSIGGSTIYFSDNLDIGSNQSYEFRKGTYKFSSGKKINVYGELKIDGSSSSPVRLTSSGSSWNGIYFAPGSQGDLQHTGIDNLSGGYYSGAITIASSSPQFQYCDIEVTSGSNVYAVYTSGNYQTPIFYKSKIKSNSQSVFKTSGSGAYLSIHDCEIVQNSGNPAISVSDGVVEFWVAATIFQGKNKIKGGKLYASNSGIIRAGLSSGQRDINHFCDSPAANLHVFSGGTIYARYNYWTNGADPTQTNNGGAIYYDNNLGAASCSGVYKAEKDLTLNTPPIFA